MAFKMRKELPADHPLAQGPMIILARPRIISTNPPVGEDGQHSSCDEKLVEAYREGLLKSRSDMKTPDLGEDPPEGHGDRTKKNQTRPDMTVKDKS
jgi:hypothetical protein